MKGNRLLVGLLCVLSMGFSVAQNKKNTGNKIIYKWEADGLVYYSHLKPKNVSDYEKLDAKGRKIEELSEDFDEIVEIAVRPQEMNDGEVTPASGSNVAGAEEIAAEVAEERNAKIREQNCATAQKNMTTINSGEVYERDPNGNMIRLTPEQIKSKRSNVQKDIEYFCGGVSQAQ